MATSIQRSLSAYLARERISFHTPGHKGRAEFFEGLTFPQSDLTELPELDSLCAPKGILLEAQRKAARAFGAEQTFFLVNGATAGNLAMLLAVTNCAPPTAGRRFVSVDRYAHRSVGSAFVLSGLTPCYVMPVMHPDFQLAFGADEQDYWGEPEGTLVAVHVTCPSYYGAALDLRRILKMRDIREMCDKGATQGKPGNQNEWAGQVTPVLVDQAHGAHWRGDLFPTDAVALGADAVVHSVHKTLASLTQSALLHVQGQRLDQRVLAQALEMVQSSSPSYLLMASLEAAIEQGDTPETFELWRDLLAEAQALRQQLGDVYRVLGEGDVGRYGVSALDGSKILVNTSPLGVDAGVVAEELRREFGIEPELWDGRNILFVLGVGNRPADVQKLRRALGDLADRRSWRRGVGQVSDSGSSAGIRPEESVLSVPRHVPPMRLTPREAWLAPRRLLKLRECQGKIAGETLVTYPPGVPYVVAGEEMTEEVMHYVVSNRFLQGVSQMYVIDE